MAPNNIIEIIGWMEEARASHRDWAEHLEHHDASGDPCAQCEGKPYKLNAANEREWERRYGIVIDTLRGNPPIQILDELHHVFTMHNIVSRARDYEGLVTDIVSWAARACRHSKVPDGRE